MNVDDSFRDFVLDQLRARPGFSEGRAGGVDALECRPMFGGYGLYQGKTFFGILFRGRVYFKTDAESRAVYRDAGMKPFRPRAAQTLTSYYEVPVDILEDADQLVAWARRAVQCRTPVAERGARHR